MDASFEQPKSFGLQQRLAGELIGKLKTFLNWEKVYKPEFITSLKGHTAAIRKIAISRDGTMLVWGGDDNTLILWNLQRILNLDALAYGCSLA